MNRPDAAASRPAEPLGIDRENERLRQSWNALPITHLADYLSIEEQDQRINTHSILTRALLIDTLWPDRFSAWIDEELRFGLVMSWLLQALRSGVRREVLLETLLEDGPDDSVPRLLRDTVAWLQTADCPLPDYVSEALLFRHPDHPDWYLSESAMDTFASLWPALLPTPAAPRLSLLEIACGSGNDYAAIERFGLAAHIDYAGFDISWKNVQNARSRFPGVRFFESSILNSDLPDASFDILFVHDLIGHLSADGMETALKEIMRIVRREAWLHCHNVADIERHEIRPFRLYHKNRLSYRQLSASLEAAGATVETVPLSGLLEGKFGYAPDYTAAAGTFIARQTPAG